VRSTTAPTPSGRGECHRRFSGKGLRPVENMRYHLITYGCQMNEADSDLMASLLDQTGWSRADSVSEADLVVVNTCSVRQKPEQKVYTLLGRLGQEKMRRPEMVVAVTGCMAQAAGEDLVRQARVVDVVLGTRCFHRIAEAVGLVRADRRQVVMTDLGDDPSQVRCSLEPPLDRAAIRAFVPIVLGCSNYCSYCIVPYVRGQESSRPLTEILREVRVLAARGTREVTLLGQNVLAWGRDLQEGALGQASGPNRAPFTGMLRAVADIERLWRVRFLTCHPRDVGSDLILAMRDLERVCEHIHLPIQAGTNKLLGEMNRGYTVDGYLEVVDSLRAAVPGIAITTDIMVGFPGESDADFEDSLELYRRLQFDAAFTFGYSPRPGTAAARRPDQVPRETIRERLNRLIEMQNRITVQRNREQVGSIARVLVEGPAERGDGLLTGHTRTNKQVVFAGDRSLVGTLLRVKLIEAHLWGFAGELAGAGGE